MQPHADVEASVWMRQIVADDTITRTVSLRYSAADPYAVRAVFREDDVEIEWVFARDLLRIGLSADISGAEVAVWPIWPIWRNGDGVAILLISPEGEAMLEASGDDVRDFLDRTTAVVPYGEEGRFIDLDALVARLLSTPPAS